MPSPSTQPAPAPRRRRIAVGFLSFFVPFTVLFTAAVRADDTPATEPSPASLFLPDLSLPEQTDPIGALSNQMQSIVGDLADMHAGAPVQAKQRQVVATLDELIKELEKQTGHDGGMKNPNPTSPMQKSMISKGPGGQGPLHDPKAGTRVWGQLPPKERDQIMQSQTEGFPPGYEAVLSSYYSRLAQGQVNSDAGNVSAHATTQP
jgi:hypothetical protein